MRSPAGYCQLLLIALAVLLQLQVLQAVSAAADDLIHTAALTAAALAAPAAATPQALGPVTCPPPTANGTFPFPVDTSDFCNSIGLNKPSNTFVCYFWSALQEIVANSKDAPLVCVKQPPSTITKDLKGFYIPQPLPNRLHNGQLPATLPASVMEVEGGTYNWLYVTILRFAGWTPCKTLGDNTPWETPKGWELTQTLYLKENLTESNAKATNVQFPAVAILKQGQQPRQRTCRKFLEASQKVGSVDTSVDEICGGGHVVAVVRGTMTGFEGNLNLDYNLVSDASFGPGQIHSGFKRVVNEVWAGGFKAMLNREFVRGSGSSRHLTITGNSLGGGAAVLLAAKAEKYLAATCTRKAAAAAAAGNSTATTCKPFISVVTFAGPNAGSQLFVNDFNKRINARALEFKYDIVPQVPCLPKMTTCPNAPVPTNSPKGYVAYAATGGRISFDGTDMPVQQTAWSKLALYRQKEYCDNNNSIAGLKSATHLCSYLCKTGSYTGEPMNWCLLWPAQGNETRTWDYCLDGSGRDTKFPMTNPLYPPEGDL